MNVRSGKRQFWSWLLLVVSGLLPVLMVYEAFTHEFIAQSDFPQFLAAAKLLAQGRVADIYDPLVIAQVEHSIYPELGSRVVNLYLPPYAVSLLAPLAVLPDRLALGLFTLGQLICLIGSAVVLQRAFQLTATSTANLLTGLFIFPPTAIAMFMGQLSPFLLLSFSLSLWALKRDRPVVAGLALSFLLVKPQEILPVLFFLFGAKRIKPIVIVLSCGILLFLLSLLIGGIQAYVNNIHLLHNLPAYLHDEVLCPTLRGQLLRIPALNTTVVTVGSAAVFICALGAIFAYGRKMVDARNWLEAGVLLAVPLGLLTSMHFHNYDWLLLAPSAVAFVQGGFAARLTRFQLFSLVPAAVFFILPVYLITWHDYLLAGNTLNPFFFAFAYVVLLEIRILLENEQLLREPTVE